ncbi:SRPBCC family protein [Streptosporangium sp. NPDC087985]|uniref:SRPBCC family protein n=1 Tax=Streptosporangium sp. NPDC087985 TaxID=3366196 RepID=UPI00382B4734
MAMRFEHEFTVPVPVEQAWSVLLDVERVAPCLPGAALDTVDGDSFTGRMKVKVGPITVTYLGDATFEDVDKDAHVLTIKAAGKESRGAGTAGATVTARLYPAGPDTRVTVETSFSVTGRPAQFGRGLMAEIGEKLIDRFAANLAELLREHPVTENVPAPPPLATVRDEAEPVRHLTAVPSPPETAMVEKARGLDTHPAGTARTSLTPEEEALDLMEIAGIPLLRRAAPVAAALTGLVLAGWLVRRTLRRRH